MAALCLTKFGERITARWSAGTVYVQYGDDPETAAFALASDSPLYLDEEPDGALVIVYLTATGAVAMKRSRNRSSWT